jgi:hypothetical protein
MKRIWHPWTDWECYRAGFFATLAPPPLDAEQALLSYTEFLRDTSRFERALGRVITAWPTSCEHWLSHEGMNRIAWLGQAAMCIATGVPAVFRGGFKRLSVPEQRLANSTARVVLNGWLTSRGEAPT